MAHQFCDVRDEGRLRIVTLNRPEVMNALHADAHEELEKVWDELHKTLSFGSALSPAPGIAPFPPAMI